MGKQKGAHGYRRRWLWQSVTALELAGTGEVTLITDENHFLFKPMLYEYLSGEVEEWHVAPPYKELCLTKT